MLEFQIVQLSVCLIILAIGATTLLKLLGFKSAGLLQCGLFGACGSYDLSSIKILGIANEERGGHGTGYYSAPYLVKGIDDARKFPDFIKKERLIKSTKYNDIIIGHTRKATKGAHDEHNTHPFAIGPNNEMILAHNGTIDNIDELLKKYKTDTGNIDVDSYALGKLIFEHGYKILNEYQGAAALSFVRDDGKHDGESLFLYKGMTPAVKGGDMYEERPLYGLQRKNEDGSYVFYYSSLKEPLEVIAEGDEEVIDLECNVLYRVRKGKLSKTKVVIDRTYKQNSDFYKNRKSVSCNNKVAVDAETNLSKKAKEDSSVDLKFNPPTVAKGQSLVKFDVSEGIYKIYDENGRAILPNGRYYIAEDGDVTFLTKKAEENSNLAQTYTDKKKKKKYFLRYFIKGALIKGKVQYEKALKMNVDTAIVHFAMKISCWCEHPVSDKMSNFWYADSVKANCMNYGNIEFCDFKLTIQDGKLLHAGLKALTDDVYTDKSKETPQLPFVEERHKGLEKVTLTDDEQQLTTEIMKTLSSPGAQDDILESGEVSEQAVNGAYTIMKIFLKALYPEYSVEDIKTYIESAVETAEEHGVSLLHILSKERADATVSPVLYYVKEYVIGRGKGFEELSDESKDKLIKGFVEDEVFQMLNEESLETAVLNLVTNSDEGSYPQEIATVIEKHNDSLRANLKALANKNNHTELLNILKK